MWPRARVATTVLSVAAIVVIVVLLAYGAVRGAGGTGGSAQSGDTGAAAATPCGSATDAVTRRAMLVVARRLRDEEHAGPTVSRARASIESDGVLARAVARGDAASARREALVLLFNHEHIVTLRVLRGGALIARVGGRLVLSPVFATLRVGGRVVGSVEFSVQDDMGYRLLTERLLGVAVVMRYRGAIVMADIDAGSSLPSSGVVRIGGVRYLVATIVAGRFPDGRLRISLLMPSPAAALADVSCAQVRADLLASIAQRVYGESFHGPAAVIGRDAVAASLVLPKALSSGDDARALASVRRLLRDGHLVGLAVRGADGRLVADVGIGEPALGPLAVPLRRHGVTVGQALIAVQSANSFVGVSSYLTGADILVRAGARQLAGRVSGPASLPASGALTWRGRRYHVASFVASRFPSGSATVYALVRDGQS